MGEYNIKLSELKNAVNYEPTIMNDNKELSYIKEICNLKLADIENDMKIFEEIISQLTYSFQENYLYEKNYPEAQDIVNWAIQLELETNDTELKILLIDVVFNFSKNIETAKEKLTSEFSKIFLAKNNL